MSKRTTPRDPELVWRELMALRCEWATMLYGSWKYRTAYELACDHFAHQDPKPFGPPQP